MSGHSHWSSIKHQKETNDQKRGKVFSKLSRLISVLSKEKGGDPATNASLRLAIEKAKKENMPKDNIDRAIKKGTGEIEGVQLENVLYEIYGPEGLAVIVEGITDNKNRTLAEIKQIIGQNKGKLADSGSVKWMFERKGVISIPTSESLSINKEDLELLIIEAGAEDIKEEKESLDVYTKPEDMENIKKILKEKNIEIEYSSLDWVAKEEVKLNEKNREIAEKLFEQLNENDAVQEIFSNLSF